MLGAEHCRAQIARRHVAQHAGHDPPAAERLEVLPHRVAGSRAAPYEVPRRGVHGLGGLALELRPGHGVAGRLPGEAPQVNGVLPIAVVLGGSGLGRAHRGILTDNARPSPAAGRRIPRKDRRGVRVHLDLFARLRGAGGACRLGSPARSGRGAAHEPTAIRGRAARRRSRPHAAALRRLDPQHRARSRSRSAAPSRPTAR